MVDGETIEVYVMFQDGVVSHWLPGPVSGALPLRRPAPITLQELTRLGHLI